MSIVRENLLKRLGYTPYCGAEKCPAHWPRTTFRDGQFHCSCGWQSSFEPGFIEKYKAAQKELYERGEQPEIGL